ncbi:MAG: phage tail protein [Roseiflexaceae bacterium]
MTINRQVYATHRFWVEIDGITEAVFSECSGLQADTEVLSWEEGGMNSYVHQLPGRTKFSNLTLKRGIGTSTLWDWFSAVSLGRGTRRNLSIVLQGYLPRGGTATLVRWNVTGALPIKWTGPSLRTDSNEAALETLELIHQGFVRV